MPGPTVHQSSGPRVLGDVKRRVRAVEAGGERWVYFGSVGIDGIDAFITPDSPPFKNGWTQAGGDNELFAFVLRANGWLHTRGVPTGGADNTVVATLPVECRPKKPQHFTSAGRVPGSVVTWRVEPNGDVVYETQIGGGSGGGGEGGAFLQFDLDNTGDWLEVEATGLNPDAVQVGGPDGVTGGWSFSINGTDGSAIGDKNQLWITAPSLFLYSDVTAALGGFVEVNSGDAGVTDIKGGGANMRLYSDYVQFGCDGGFEVDSDAAGGGVFLYGVDASLVMDVTGILMRENSGQNISLMIDAGAKVLVLDHNGNTIFEVDENGDLHGKTGKSLVFDR